MKTSWLFCFSLLLGAAVRNISIVQVGSNCCFRSILLLLLDSTIYFLAREFVQPLTNDIKIMFSQNRVTKHSALRAASLGTTS